MTYQQKRFTYYVLSALTIGIILLHFHPYSAFKMVSNTTIIFQDHDLGYTFAVGFPYLMSLIILILAFATFFTLEHKLLILLGLACLSILIPEMLVEHIYNNPLSTFKGHFHWVEEILLILLSGLFLRKGLRKRQEDRYKNTDPLDQIK